MSLVARAQESVSEVAVYETVDASEPVERMANPTANGGPLVLLIDGRDASGERLPVHLPIPPNGSKGWIDADAVSVSRHSFRIAIDKAAHRLTLTEEGEPLLDVDVAVGQVGRQTPTGVPVEIRA